jgi:branched-chain amino acid transport system substrate-binding protein
MRKPAVIAGVLALALSAAACAGSSSSGSSSSGSKAPIVIGETTPLSGPSAAACEPISNGFGAWINYTNSHGGVGGRPIDLQVLDDAYTAPRAVANAQQFVRERVAAVSGGCGTIQPPAIYPILSKAGIPYLFPYAAYAGLLSPVQPDYFSIIPPYPNQVAAITTYAMTAPQYGAGSVGAFFTQLPGVNEEVSQAQNAVQSHGGSWDGAQIVASTEPDLTPFVLKMKKQSPDYLLMLGAGQEVLRYVQAMKSQGWFPRDGILLASSNTNGSFLTPAAPDLTGRVLGVSPVAMNGPTIRLCQQALQDAKVTVEAEALTGCALAQVLVTTLTEAKGNYSAAAIRSLLQGWSAKQASPTIPPLTFEAGNHLGERSMILASAKSGQWSDVTTIDVP